MKKMLINVRKEELRIAIINGNKLYDLNIENKKFIQKKYNIYKGKISRIEPSLNAVFINYGSKKNGFLPIKEISKEYFDKKTKIKNKNFLYKGQELIVQINKEERNNKGALLTTFISLIGSNLILLPNNPKINGISKKIEGNDRTELKSYISLLNLPIGMGLIIRTASIGKTIENLKLDLSLKLKHWETIKKKAKKNNAPFLIHKENNILIRTCRDYLNKDIKEIIIDNINIYNITKKYIVKIGKEIFINRIKLYKKKTPLFVHFKIEYQIENIFKKQVRLPSGGSIIIETTEALTVIDINSSKYTKCKNIENTALNTNLEAVEEILKQIRLRNLGGLIVIDFIDMLLIKNQKIIEKKFKKISQQDRAKIKINNISKFGLLEISRQRLNIPIKDLHYYKCPRCKGNGIIRNNESLSLLILRTIEEKILKKNTKEIHIIAPINITLYLLNEKKNAIYNIKKKQKKNIKIIIIANKKIKSPNYFIIRIKKKKWKNNLYYKFLNIYIKKNIYIYKIFKYFFKSTKNNLIKITNLLTLNIKNIIYFYQKTQKKYLIKIKKLLNKL